MQHRRILFIRQLDLLLALVQNSGHILSKDEVMKIVWPNTSVEEGNVARNISTLRSALGERSREGQFIETIPWRGYRFMAAVRKIHEQEHWPAIDSIAVLPFVNINADARTEYLADGITESLIRNLAQLTRLRVTSRNSAFRYKNRDADALAIGRELKVASVLLGRLAESDDLLSISVELVDTVDERHLWGAQYIRNRGDLFTAQETIAREIAEKLRIQISDPQRQLLGKRQTENSEAYLFFLKGRFHFNKLTLDGVQKGDEYFRKAVELDPNYALAYAGLSTAYILAPFYTGADRREANAKVQIARLCAAGAVLAGTEVGVKDPEPTFSPCFGGPFLVWHPTKYAEMLADKLRKHGAQTWLVNTGWSGGPYGVGARIKLKYTRAIIDAIHSGALLNAPTVTDPVFGLAVPTSCPDVPAEILQPRNTWADKAAYDEKAKRVASLFRENFKKYEAQASAEVRAGGPKL